jgi:uncharacterized membrane protein
MRVAKSETKLQHLLMHSLGVRNPLGEFFQVDLVVSVNISLVEGGIHNLSNLIVVDILIVMDKIVLSLERLLADELGHVASLSLLELSGGRQEALDNL